MWRTLTEDQQDEVAHSVGLLAALGPALDFPYGSKVNGSRHGHMRELRTQSGGRPLRTLCAFDPLRTAIPPLAVIRLGTIAGMKSSFRSQISSTTNTWTSFGERECSNANTQIS